MAFSAMTMQSPSVLHLRNSHPCISLPRDSFSPRFLTLKLNRRKPFSIRSTSIPGASPFPWFLCIYLKLIRIPFTFIYLKVTYVLDILFHIQRVQLMSQSDWNFFFPSFRYLAWNLMFVPQIYDGFQVCICSVELILFSGDSYSIPSYNFHIVSVKFHCFESLPHLMLWYVNILIYYCVW